MLPFHALFVGYFSVPDAGSAFVVGPSALMGLVQSSPDKAEVGGVVLSNYISQK